MIINMYITMLPVIIGGILNMIFTKSPLYKKLKTPIDGNLHLRDGKRLFGDNKTWIGFFSMIVFCSLAQLAEGKVLDMTGMSDRNEFYLCNENTPLYNIVSGILLGFMYVLFELPNSFIKRRLDIPAGKTIKGGRGIFFFLFDQIDSLTGVMLILFIVSEISVAEYLLYVLLGGFTHISVNAVLYACKIRKNL